MGTVIIYTPAYNAEKTLKLTVNSVLAQTHTDFMYYLLDNASTDNTYEIVKEYAERDRRIVPLHNEINRSGNMIWDVIQNHSNDCYVCELDADDEYAPDFLEKMLTFMKNYNLEIAACGNNFIDVQTKRLVGIRKLSKNLILECNGFNEHFTQYYQFMRAMWGKVYSVSVFRETNWKEYVTTLYGTDTLFTMTAFQKAKRVGILSESLHRYYISPKSDSYKFNEDRITSDSILFDAARNFLITKCGTVSQENLNFLYHVYLNASQDTINVLLNSQISVTDKLNRLRDIFQCQHTQELVQWPGLEVQKNKLFRQVAVWVLSQKEVCCDMGLETAADILAAMGVHPTRINGWQDCWVFLLLTKLKNKLPKTVSLCKTDDQIVSITSKLPLLAGLDAEFLTFYPEIVFSIMIHDEKKALRQIKEIIERETDIPDEYIEAFLTLGLNLSAKLEYAKDFIYFKKLHIWMLIEFSRIDEAQEELADWEEILPNDMDFEELRGRLLQ
ncbi:MAG: glycosyltransferase family 2 protein [Bacillota bacterium]